MSARRVNVRDALARIARDHDLDLRNPRDVDSAVASLCASLRYRISAAQLRGVAAAAKRCPVAQAAQARRVRNQQRAAYAQ